MDDNQDPLLSSSPSATEDWESRFKGLQRRYNTETAELRAQVERLEKEKASTANALEAARASMTDAQQQIQALRADTVGKAKEYEQAIARLSAEQRSLTETAEAARKTAEEAQARLGLFEKKDQTRKLFNNPDFEPLRPFYEEGHIAGLEDLDEEAAKERLTNFKQFLANRFQQSFTNAMNGSTPPPPAVQDSVAANGMKTEDMSKWLQSPENLGSPQYDAISEAYYARMSKKE